MFLINKKLKEMVSFLKNNPNSKRAIINLWRNKYKNPSLSVPCLVYLYFRIKNKHLILHSHFRANNIFFLLTMDMQMMLTIQNYIAINLKIEPGEYIHFVDSLHFYKEQLKPIKSQYQFMSNSPHWNF